MPGEREEGREGETEPANLSKATIFVYKILTFYCVLYILPLLIPVFFYKLSKLDF